MSETMEALAEDHGDIFRIEEVSVYAGPKRLLGPVTLDLPKGELVALVGHNGSGKSTLLKLLARQQQPSTGRILLRGRPIQSRSGREFSRIVAYLPQSIPAADGMLVRELVAFGRYPWHGALGRISDADLAAIADSMRLTGTAEFSDRFLDSLSGGERQRAWIAMMLAQTPQCMLLDEPISALDIAHQLEILSLLRRLVEDRGISAIVVLHDINLAARFCHHIVALHSGRMIIRGEPEEIMRPGILKDIYGVEMEVMRHPDLSFPISISR